MADKISVRSSLRKILPDEAGVNIGIFYAKWGISKNGNRDEYDLSSIPKDNLRELINEIRNIRQQVSSSEQLANLEKQARIEVMTRESREKKHHPRIEKVL